MTRIGFKSDFFWCLHSNLRHLWAFCAIIVLRHSSFVNLARTVDEEERRAFLCGETSHQNPRVCSTRIRKNCRLLSERLRSADENPHPYVATCWSRRFDARETPNNSMTDVRHRVMWGRQLRKLIGRHFATSRYHPSRRGQFLELTFATVVTAPSLFRNTAFGHAIDPHVFQPYNRLKRPTHATAVVRQKNK